MKNIFKISILFIGISFITISSLSQIFVGIRPTLVRVNRPPQQNRHQVWVDEEWSNAGGHYRYTGGRWENPPNPGFRRYPGFWRRERRGYA